MQLKPAKTTGTNFYMFSEVRARLRAASLAAIGKVTSDLQVEAPLPEHWYQCCGTVVGGEGATNLASSPRSGGP